VQAKVAAGKHVHLVDMHATLAVPDLLADGVHPTNGGYAKMDLSGSYAFTRNLKWYLTVENFLDQAVRADTQVFR